MARSFQHLGVYTNWEALWISLFKSFCNQVPSPLPFLGVRGGAESSHPLTGLPFLSPAPGLRYLGSPPVSPTQYKLQGNGKWPLMNNKDTAITQGLTVSVPGSSDNDQKDHLLIDLNLWVSLEFVIENFVCKL